MSCVRDEDYDDGGGSDGGGGGGGSGMQSQKQKPHTMMWGTIHVRIDICGNHIIVLIYLQ